MTVRQTAGRDQLGDFAPAFARINDDVLFGEVWSRTETLGLRDRSIVTVVSLVSQGLVDASLEYHLRCCLGNRRLSPQASARSRHEPTACPAAFIIGSPHVLEVQRGIDISVMMNAARRDMSSFGWRDRRLH